MNGPYTVPNPFEWRKYAELLAPTPVREPNYAATPDKPRRPRKHVDWAEVERRRQINIARAMKRVWGGKRAQRLELLRERFAPAVTSAQAREALGLSYSATHALLGALVGEGHLTPVGKGKRTRYVFT